MFANIKPTEHEIKATLPGDAIIQDADVVMDRAFSLPGTVEEVWPWFVQLGKNRAGWYFPKSVERFIPAKKRGLWVINPELQDIEVGRIVDDWGGKGATFEIAEVTAPYSIVNISKRSDMDITWTIHLKQETASTTRVQLRLRLGNVKQKWVAESGGELVDLLTVAGLAAGLKQRLVHK